jgi:hypothetical protein
MSLLFPRAGNGAGQPSAAKPSEGKEKMIRSLKMLGLLTVAAFVMSAVVASAANGEVLLTAGKTPETHTTTRVHGVQAGSVTENYFQTKTAGEKELNITCAKVRFYGEVSNGTDREVELFPEYEECGVTNNTTHEVPNHRVTVTMEGCIYKFTEPTQLEPETYTGKVHLVCPLGKHPTLHQFANATQTIEICTIEVHSATEGQGELSHVVYHNEDNNAEKDDVTATVAIENIKYFTKGKFCPEPNTTKENGKYVSNITLTSGETNANKETVSLEDDLWLSTA